ncbi:PREDICTED: uncharacterized protein LOC104827213 [Tarenaya hassleriana]|uniref:uncharacterized protein LOC104827213 n=1 Tax=Tarenaya hassleriana TaxID=28532 RepID=UPI00053C6663|nr:PREDICTED: uncharacterized protein LOC104827213 [Tarenaya hassleriana]
MANHIIIAIITIMFLVASSSIHAEDTQHDDLSMAMEEMQRANYYSFVMLINMLPSVINPRFLANITFLMPKDKTLSRAQIQEDSVPEFLLRHSIPSPLLFEHLNLFPNGSTIPSSLDHYSLQISNGGRYNYHLNNVKIVSRNICTSGSIKCHGIDGILTLETNHDDDSPLANRTVPFTSCPSSGSGSGSSSDTSPPPVFPPIMAPSPSDDPRKSESSKLSRPNTLNGILLLLLLLLGLGLCIINI